MAGQSGANYLLSGIPPRAMGNAHPNIVPYQVFATAGSHIIIAVGNDTQFAAFAEVFGLAIWRRMNALPRIHHG